MYKKVLFILLSQLAINFTFAQSTIFKCIDSEGGISYTSDKNNNCEKTSLGNFNKSTILNKLPGISSIKTPNISGDHVVSDEQKIKDQKRSMILQNELNQEKNELQTVSDMLKKIDKNGDEKQINQLKSMEELHKKNIASIQKELGISKSVEMIAVTPRQPLVKGLPLSMPNEDEQQKLIASVAPNNKKNDQKIEFLPKKNEKPTVAQEEKIKEPEAIRVSVDSVDKPLITNSSIKKKFIPLDFTNQKK